MSNIKTKAVHKYFSRKSSNWNIIDFLEECDDLEPYGKKIEEYLLSLEAIVNMEKDQKRGNAQKLLDKYKQSNRPDKKKSKEWDNERSRKQVYLHQPTINGTVSGMISSIGTINSVSGTINGGAFDLKKSDQGEQSKRDPHTKRDAKIDNYFQYEQVQPQCTLPHRIFSCGASSGASEGSAHFYTLLF